jgi:pilus assembly protein CpaE
VAPCHGPCDGNVLALNVAAVIAQRTGTCALLDYHLRGGDLSLLLKATPRHTVYDLLRQRDRLDDGMLQQALTSHASGIRLLAGPPMFSDLRGIESGACQRILTMAQYAHPYVVVNCEDVAHTEQIQSVAGSDYIILAIRMDLLSLHRAKQHIEFLVRNRVPASRIQVVAMACGRSGELPASAIKSVLGVSSLHRIPDDEAAITMSINVGNPFVLESPKAAISRGVFDLVDLLTGDDKSITGSKAAKSLLGKAAAALALHTISY